jgi:hypothetical protein
LIFIPSDEQHIDTDHFVLIIIGMSAFLAMFFFCEWRTFGRDYVSADESGLEVVSQRNGNRRLRWEDVAEIGWINAAEVGPSLGGLAGRLREDDAHGRSPWSQARWLCHPLGRLRPPELAALRRLAEQGGTSWNDSISRDVESFIPAWLMGTRTASPPKRKGP